MQKVAILVILMTSLLAVAQQYQPYSVIAKGETRMPDQLKPADLGRHCSIYVKTDPPPNTKSLGSADPEGMTVLKDGYLIITGELAAISAHRIVVHAFYDASREEGGVRQSSWAKSAIDFIILK